MSKSSPRLITPVAILSYPHLKAPQKSTNPGGKDKYSVSLVFTKESLSTPDGAKLFQAMQDAARAAGVAKFGDQFEALLKAPTFHRGFRRDWETKGYPQDSVFINARSEQRPGLVYSYATPGTNTPARVPDDKIDSVFYPGALVRASVTAFAFINSGNKGLGFAINNLQFIKDGERLDNRVAAENEFTVLNQEPASLEGVL